MAEIQVIDKNDENLFSYTAEIIPRKGEHLTVQGDESVLEVTYIEHYLRPHGGTGQLISPCVRISVDSEGGVGDGRKS